MQQFQKPIISLAVVIILVVVGWLGYQEFLAPESPAPTPTPNVNEVIPISAEGRIMPARDATLAFRFGGRVANVLIAEGDTVVAGQILTSLEMADLQANLTQAEAALDAARAEDAMNPGDASQAQKDLTAAYVAQAEAAYDAALSALNEAQLLAPFDGIVTSVGVKTSEVAAPGAPAIVVADTSRWTVETLDLREEDAVQINEGQIAEVKIASLPGLTFSGVVSRIALSASSYQGNVTYDVTIDLSITSEDDLEELNWGMTAFVEMEPDGPDGFAIRGTVTAVPRIIATPTPQPQDAFTAVSPTPFVPTPLPPATGTPGMQAAVPVNPVDSVLVSAGNNDGIVSSEAVYYITWPLSGAVVQGAVDILGTAMFDPAKGEYFTLDIGKGASPRRWATLGNNHSRPVEGGPLAQLQTDMLTPGDYVLRLGVVSSSGHFVGSPYQVPIRIEH